MPCLPRTFLAHHRSCWALISETEGTRARGLVKLSYFVVLHLTILHALVRSRGVSIRVTSSRTNKWGAFSLFLRKPSHHLLSFEQEYGTELLTW